MSTLASKTVFYNVPLRKSLFLAVAVMPMVIAALPTPAAAAPIGAVLAACDRTKGCDYTTDSDGSVTGCSAQSGVCFTCSPKTRQCVGTGTPARGAQPDNKPIKGPGLVKVLGASSKPIKSARPAPGVAPATAGNAPAGDKPGSVKPFAPKSTKPTIASAPNVTKPKVQSFPISKPKNEGQPVASNNNQGTTAKGGQRR